MKFNYAMLLNAQIAYKFTNKNSGWIYTYARGAEHKHDL